MREKKYVIKWDKKRGKYTQRIWFGNRHYAILFLNMMILDKGIHDAILVVE